MDGSLQIFLCGSEIQDGHHCWTYLKREWTPWGKYFRIVLCNHWIIWKQNWWWHVFSVEIYQLFVFCVDQKYRMDSIGHQCWKSFVFQQQLNYHFIKYKKRIFFILLVDWIEFYNWYLVKLFSFIVPHMSSIIINCMLLYPCISRWSIRIW